MTKAVTGRCMGCMSTLEGQEVCPRCGYAVDADFDHNYIQPGTVLGSRYVVGQLVHKNGEGAQYVGYDNSVQQRVWIHEYFPHTIAQRGEETGNVLPLKGFGAQYKAQMSDFLDICNEVKRLSITEPVVPIENVLNENNTLYAVYKDLQLVPLEHYLREQGGRLPLEEALEMFLPLLNTLSNIHGHGQIHRGLSPYTLYADTWGKLYLWHFALAATRTAGSELDAELFSGYSAPEQYSPNGWQGTWTDVYAVGALLYRTLSGVVPPKSTLIGPNRPLRRLEDLVMGLPKEVSDAIDAAMRPSSEQRTQAVATLTSQLTQTGLANTAVYDVQKMNRIRQAGDDPPPPIKKRSQSRPERPGIDDEEELGLENERTFRDRFGSLKYIFLALLLTVLVLLGLMWGFMRFVYPDLAPESSSSSSRGNGNEDEEIFGGIDDDDDTQSSSSSSQEDNVIPRVVGRRLSDVRLDSSFTGSFSYDVQEEFSDDYDEGVIYEQSPVEGTAYTSGTTITLYVSKGPEMVEMPDLVGLTLEDALVLLEELNEHIDPRTFVRHDNNAEPETIVTTTPLAGTEFNPKKDSVILFVSPEKEEVSSSEPEPPPSSEPSVPKSIFDR